MKNKFYFTLLFVLFFCFPATSQIENEIKVYVDSTEVLINNGRKYLVQSLKYNKIEKVKEIYLFLLKKGEDYNCKSFTFKENLLLLTVLKDWNGLLEENDVFTYEAKSECYQNMFNIEEQLNITLKENRNNLLADLHSQNLNAENKALIEILLHIQQYGPYNDNYDILIKRFRKNYPNTQYSKYTKKHLPEPNYGGSLSISIGPKFSNYFGNFNDYFKNSTGFSFSINFCLPRIYASISIEESAIELKKPISLANKWNETHNFEKGNSFEKFEIDLKTGIYLVRSKNNHIAPYCTLLARAYMNSDLYNSTNNNNTNSNESPDKEFYIFECFTLGGGVHLEQKIWTFNNKNYNQYYPNTNSIGSYLSLKLDLGYSVIPKYIYSPAKSDMAYATFGLVWGLGKF